MSFYGRPSYFLNQTQFTLRFIISYTFSLGPLSHISAHLAITSTSLRDPSTLACFVYCVPTLTLARIPVWTLPWHLELCPAFASRIFSFSAESIWNDVLIPFEPGIFRFMSLKRRTAASLLGHKCPWKSSAGAETVDGRWAMVLSSWPHGLQ